ncbi:MAG: methyltransferase domain-containing protein [Lachnospiraceae bacterium]|nr:methyltransferase domain-containing protein [Lachnospiraceae bacterium]
MNLFCKTGDDYQNSIIEYENNLPNFFAKLEAAADSYPKALKNQEYLDYVKYHKWAIRKQEYSYVIREVDKSLSSGCKLLEAGCGVSPMPFLWAYKGAQVTAVDIAENTIGLMKSLNDDKFFETKGNSVSFVEASIDALPFEDDSFDIVESVSVLEHLRYPNYLLALYELRRVLKPNGRMVLTCDVTADKNMKTSWIGAFSKKDIEDFLDAFKDELDTDSQDYKGFQINKNTIDDFWMYHSSNEGEFKQSRGYGAIGFSLTKSNNRLKPYLIDESKLIDKSKVQTEQIESLNEIIKIKDRELLEKEDQIRLINNEAQNLRKVSEEKENQIRLISEEVQNLRKALEEKENQIYLISGEAQARLDIIEEMKKDN